MNNKNFMIGDWVRHINGTPYQVTCLKHDDFACGIPHLWSYNNRFELIEITGELLDKNGFSYRSLGGAEEWFIADDYYDIVVHEWSDSIWVFRYDGTEMNTPHEQRVIGYLHELQHAFRDCGIEKEWEV